MTFFLYREPITEYGRVFTEDRSEQRDTRWFRTIVLGRVHIDGNPNHPYNGGIVGLADVSCLGAMANHSTKQNASYRTFDFTSVQALRDTAFGSDVSLGHCMILVADRDIEKDEQILCNYEPTTGSTMKIPFAKISLGQFIKICYRSVRKSVHESLC